LVLVPDCKLGLGLSLGIRDPEISRLGQRGLALHRQSFLIHEVDKADARSRARIFICNKWYLTLFH